MSPAEFVNEIALPTVRDFRDNPRSRRHAYLACIVTLHVGDHLRAAKDRDIGARVRANCGEAFGLVHAAGNAAKHRGPDRSDPLKFKVGADFDRPPGRAGELQCGLSRLGDAKGGRNVATGVPGGTDIYEAVTRMLKAYVAEAPATLDGCDLSNL